MNKNIEKVFQLAEDCTKKIVPEKLKWSWGQGLYLYGLSLIDEEQKTDKFTKYIQIFYDYYIKKGHRVDNSDTSSPGLGAYILWKKTGEEKYKKEVERVTEYLRNCPKIIENSMPNHFGEGEKEMRTYPKSIWVDSMMMYGVFSALYAKNENDKWFMDFAQKQPPLFEKYLKESETGLFYHTYRPDENLVWPPKPYFWGRGNGWVTASLSLIMDNFESEKAKEDAQRIHKNLSETLAKYQRKDGYFETCFAVPNKSTYTESSATMLIATGWFYGYRKGFLSEEYYERAKKAFNAVADDICKKRNLLKMPKISGQTKAARIFPYLYYSFLVPRFSDLSYGLFSAFIAAIEYKRCIEMESKKGE